MKPKSLGIPTFRYAQPLTQALRTDPSFHVVEEERPALARKLQENDLSAALLSPLDYAKESSDYCIVPDVTATSPEGNSSIVVRFREGVQRIQTLAVDPNFAAEIILTKIILAEQFDIEPSILPMIASVEVMLEKADAALVAGDAAIGSLRMVENSIDIVEEWNEMTDLPYVHALWCSRETSLTAREVEQIQSAAAKGSAGIADIVRDIPGDARDDVRRYLESFTFNLNDDARHGLAELMKYYYYHGVLPDVAELNFYKSEETGGGESLSDVSPN